MIENLDEANAARLTAEMAAIVAENEHLAESLESVRISMRIDDEGWTRLLGGQGINGDLTGFNLHDLITFAKEIRSYMVGMPLIGNAANLRANYIWSKGFNIPGSEKKTAVGGKVGQGRPSNIYTFVNNPVNMEHAFGAVARDQLEHVACTDGMVFLAGDNTKKTVRQIPIWEFTDLYVNPDFPAEVWAYRRVWQSYTPGKQSTRMDRWYYTDRFDGVRQSSIDVNGQAIPADLNITLFDQKFNGQTGWPLGIPDLLSAVPWAKMYSDAMKRGKQMTDAMAQIAYKAVSSTSSGASNMAAKIAGSHGAGNSAAMTTGNDLVPLSTAGRGYEFSTLRPIAAMVAAAAQVSTIDLLADPSAAGSSYGSAATLDPPKKRAMIARQELWKGFFRRVLKWGTGTDVDVFFPDLEDPDTYRDAQTLTLAQQSGMIFEDELRPKWLDNLDVANLHGDKMPPPPPLPPAPPGSPNAAPGAGVQAGAPGQGQATGAGKGPVNTGNRKDIISNTLDAMNLDRLEGLVRRMEAASQG